MLQRCINTYVQCHIETLTHHVRKRATSTGYNECVSTSTSYDPNYSMNMFTSTSGLMYNITRLRACLFDSREGRQPCVVQACGSKRNRDTNDSLTRNGPSTARNPMNMMKTTPKDDELNTFHIHRRHTRTVVKVCRWMSESN